MFVLVVFNHLWWVAGDNCIFYWNFFLLVIFNPLSQLHHFIQSIFVLCVFKHLWWVAGGYCVTIASIRMVPRAMAPKWEKVHTLTWVETTIKKLVVFFGRGMLRDSVTRKVRYGFAGYLYDNRGLFWAKQCLYVTLGQNKHSYILNVLLKITHY